MPDFTSGAAGAGAVGQAIGGISGANASKRAGKNAKKQAKIAAAAALAESQKAQALNTQQYDQNRIAQAAINEQNKAYMAPYRDAGIAGQNQLLTLMGLQGGNTGAADFGRYAKDFQMSDYQADPGYAFRLGEAKKEYERSAAARGGLLSGRTLQGTVDYSQNLASQEYANAYDRYNKNRSNQLVPLGAFADSGQNAATQTGSFNSNYGGNLQNASQNYAQGMNTLATNSTQDRNRFLVGAAGTRASGYIGAADAYSKAINNLIGTAATAYGGRA